ncbi:MAG: diguanylate cyclase [Spirochaetaceae bacterium]|nr:diguanylate cyclase [Spirochaetaceae bacterium]
MKKRSILSVSDDDLLFDRVREAAPPGCECVLASDCSAALEIARESKPDLVIVALEQGRPSGGLAVGASVPSALASFDSGEGLAAAGDGSAAVSVLVAREALGAEGLCRSLRRLYPRSPLQVVLSAPTLSNAARALPAGFDAVLLDAASPEHLKLELRAAFQRLAREELMCKEREFYSGAVRREENLSSQLLDEFLALKETLAAITAAKRSLETTNRRLERAATRDALSGLLNRQSLFERIRHEMRRADAEEAPLSGILVDIDHFKDINDSYGHLAGDAVIKELGRRMLLHLRKGDYAGRYGGEEFFLVLPGTDRQRASLTAERIRESLVATPFEFGGQLLLVSASFGVAEHQGAESGEGLIERADKAMYRAKQLGRNRVCIDGQD